MIFANYTQDKATKLSTMLFLYFLLSQAHGMPTGGQDFGTFWQVSDFHFDKNYSMDGLRSSYCHSINANSDDGKLGKFGDRKCDAPWLLATSAVDAMKKFKSDPDFILWTGDNSPHVPDSELNLDKVYTTVSNVTNLLRSAFPTTPIYPTMGNHDSYPANQITSDRSYYEGFLEKCSWGQLIPENSHETFLKGGYYMTEMQPGIELIMLNTNMYFTLDKLTAEEKDPAGQLEWLEKALTVTKESNHKAYIVGHVPPGVSPDLWKWMYPDINARLTDIMRRYHEVIIAGIFGHEHTDNFRIIYDENGMSVVPLFMGPAVTPWDEKNNPSMRLYTYNKLTGSILDYDEYYLDLNAANTGGEANWWSLYQAGQSYGLKDLSASSMQVLLDSLSKSLESWSFKNYLQHYSTGYTQGKTCNNTCWLQHICSIKCVNFNCFEKCLNNQSLAKVDLPNLESSRNNVTEVPYTPVCPTWDPMCKKRHHHPHPRPVPAYMHLVIYALAALVFVLFFVVTILCCCWPRRPVVFLTQPRLTFVKSWEYEPISS